MKNLFLLMLSVSALCACERMAVDEHSSITIQMPSLQSLSQKSEKQLTSQGSLVSGRPVPTGFNGPRPFNCFLVAVGGPDAELNRNTCGHKIAGTNTYTAIRKVGPWAGAVGPGQSISIGSVTPGKDRVIHVIGFHTVAAAECHDFTQGNFPDDSKISFPYRLGEVTTEVKMGTDNPVTVNLAYNVNDPESQRFDGCEGPDFPDHGNGSGGGGPATSLALEKNYFPENILIHGSASGICNTIYLSGKNANGNHATIITPTTLRLKARRNGQPLTNRKFYASQMACEADTAAVEAGVTDAQAEFTIPAGANYFPVTFKAFFNATAPTTLEFAFEEPSVGSAGGLVLPQNVVMATASSSAYVFDLGNPDRMVPNVCYPVTLTSKSLMGFAYKNTVTAVLGATPANAVQFFSDTTCTASVSSINFNVSAEAFENISMKLVGTGPIKVHTSATGYTSMTKDLYVDELGGTIPQYLDLQGHTMMGHPGVLDYYNHPYTVSLKNKNYTTIPNLTGSPISFYLDTSTSAVAAYHVVLGTGTLINAGNPASIAVGESSFPLHLKMSTDATGEFDLRVANSAAMQAALVALNSQFRVNNPLYSVRLNGGIGLLRLTDTTASVGTPPPGCYNFKLEGRRILPDMSDVAMSNATLDLNINANPDSATVDLRYFAGIDCLSTATQFGSLPVQSIGGANSMLEFSVGVFTTNSGTSYPANLSFAINPIVPAGLRNSTTTDTPLVPVTSSTALPPP